MQITEALVQELIIDFTKDIQILSLVMENLEKERGVPESLMQRNRGILQRKKKCLAELQIAFLAL